MAVGNRLPWTLFLAIQVMLALGALPSHASSCKGRRAVPAKGASMSDQPSHSAGADDRPSLELAAGRRYFIGLPIVVTLTFHNRSSRAEFYRLPQVDLLRTRGLEVTLAPKAGAGKALTTHFPPPEEGERGFDLLPGETRTTLCDLSNLGVSVVPGTYDLRVSLRPSNWASTSNSVVVELVPLNQAEADEAARLRHVGGTDTGAWGPFLSNNWNTVKPGPAFDADAKKQLALHLFLHRAWYGPAGVQDLAITALDEIDERHLAAEVATLKYEVLMAVGSPRAPLVRDAVLKGAPGYAWRLAAVDRGAGLLAQGRRDFGREKKFLRPPTRWPYGP
jgi:hypothetical protein